jgi:hypothetical protein
MVLGGIFMGKNTGGVGDGTVGKGKSWVGVYRNTLLGEGGMKGTKAHTGRKDYRKRAEWIGILENMSVH